VDSRWRRVRWSATLPQVDVVEALIRMGGVAESRRLVAVTSRRRVATAVSRGRVVRDGRGHYALPAADEARRAAARLSGVVSGASAAALHGWEVKTSGLPSVTVPAKRRVAKARRAGIDLHWRDLDPDDVRNQVLRPGPTVIDCCKTLPFDEALAIADSALRHEALTRQGLLVLAEQVATTGRAQCLRVAREADGSAANPFESVLRAISLEVRGLVLKPQVVIEDDGWSGRPDLVDERLRLVVEADSFEFHGRRRALVRDCERYNALVVRGWTVLRYSWEHVMFDPGYVRASLSRFERAVRQETLARNLRPSRRQRELPVAR
jgi:very-short-patch-repair endonuclease